MAILSELAAAWRSAAKPREIAGATRFSAKKALLHHAPARDAGFDAVRVLPLQSDDHIHAIGYLLIKR